MWCAWCVFLYACYFMYECLYVCMYLCVSVCCGVCIVCLCLLACCLPLHEHMLCVVSIDLISDPRGGEDPNIYARTPHKWANKHKQTDTQTEKEFVLETQRNENK